MQQEYERVFNDYYKKLLESIEIPTIEVDIPSEDELSEDISAFLRPPVDKAIERRRDSAETGGAEIDADAAARGMLGSTFVSSMKSREHTEAERDVASLESGYAATLAERIYEALNSARSMKLEADIHNADVRSDVERNAYDSAMDWLAMWIDKRGGSGGGSGGGGGVGSGGAGDGDAEEPEEPYDGELGSEGLPAMKKMKYSTAVRYLKTLNLSQAKNLFMSESYYWKVRRQEIRDSLSKGQFEALRKRFGTLEGRRQASERRNTYER